MKNVKPLSPYEIFNANCEAGNDKELMIRDLVESYNLRIISRQEPGAICAVGALESIYDKYGYDILDHVLSLIIATWEGEQKNDYPKNLVKAKLLKLNSMHVEYVLDCMKNNTTKIKKIRPYLLATLFNAPSTMSSYYQAEVNHDMACGLI